MSLTTREHVAPLDFVRADTALGLKPFSFRSSAGARQVNLRSKFRHAGPATTTPTAAANCTRRI